MKNQPCRIYYLLKFTSVCCLFAFASGCDIPGRLVIVNRTPNEIVLRYNSEFQSLTEVHGTELRVSNKRKERVKTILFGFGHTWTDESIADFAHILGFLEIEVNDKKTMLSDEKEIIDFLKSKRKGLMNREICLKLSN